MNGQDDEKTPLRMESGPRPPPYTDRVQPPAGYSAIPSGGPYPSAAFADGYQPAPANSNRCTVIQVVTNQPVAASFVPTPPKSWLAWSIFSALCCAWPCGLLAIVYSLRTTNYYSAGYYASAHSASRTALIWNIVSLVLGICLYTSALVYIGIHFVVIQDEEAATTDPPYY